MTLNPVDAGWIDADGNQLMYTDHELELIREQRRLAMIEVNEAWERREKKALIWDISVGLVLLVLFVTTLLLIVFGHG